jgi:esterase/lipase superfamily enzyme
MATPLTPETTLEDLLAQLGTAVRAGDRDRATELQRQILQRLLRESSQLENIEREMRSLMEELEQRALQLPLRQARELQPGRTMTLDDELASEQDEDVVFPVWFGSNRKPVLEGEGFTGERNQSVTHGRADVYIPKAHRLGEIGNPIWKRLWRLDLRDDRLRLQNIIGQTPEDFYLQINQMMQATRDAGTAPHALFYLHGFNVSFAEAAIRAAQLGWDLKVPGATAFFSWPSRGTPLRYAADEATIEASEIAITEFLIEFAAKCGAEKVHVIAHSMGNRGLLRALQRIAANAQTLGKVRFGQIFLAAPDVDQDLFLDLAALCVQCSDRATLYSSLADKAVHLSSQVHDAPRAGYFKPYTLLQGVDTITVPDFDIDLLGHSYYAQAGALLRDMRERILPSDKSWEQKHLNALMEDGKRFWRLRNNA